MQDQKEKQQRLETEMPIMQKLQALSDIKATADWKYRQGRLQTEGVLSSKKEFLR